MTLKRILVATDGSRGGEAATRLGGDIALGHDAEVLLVHVVPLPPLVYGVDQDISEEVTDYYEDSAEKAVTLSAAILDEMGVESEQILQVGRAADVILDIAEERDVDMIVVGHRGLGAMRRFVLGSVSSKLSHAAKCALLLAPVSDEAEPGAP